VPGTSFCDIITGLKDDAFTFDLALSDAERQFRLEAFEAGKSSAIFVGWTQAFVRTATTVTVTMLKSQDILLLQNPGDQTSIAGTSITPLQLVWTAPTNEPVTFIATGLPPGLQINSATGLISGTLDLTAAAGSPYTVTVTVMAGPNNDKASFRWTVMEPSVPPPPPNHPPVVANPIADVSIMDCQPGTRTVDISGTFTDPDRDALVLTVADNSASSLVTATVAGTQLALAFQSQQNGSALITVRATDPGGLSVEDTFQVTVVCPTRPPVVANPIADVTITDRLPVTRTVDLSGTFTDLDADVLVLTVTGNSNPSFVTATVAGTQLTLTFQSNQNGATVITVRATDPGGLSVEDTFQVMVACTACPFILDVSRLDDPTQRLQ
jgi:hypothetical protein